IGVFVIGSIGCALSQSLEEFVLARIVQGVGGAMMTPVGRLILLRSIDKTLLVNAMALVTIPALIGPIRGPPLGGFITTSTPRRRSSISICSSLRASAPAFWAASCSGSA